MPKHAMTAASRYSQWLLPLALAAPVISGMPVLPSGRADTIIYNDLTDTPTLIHTGTDTMVQGTCPAIKGKPCSIRLTRARQTVVASTFPGGLPLGFLLLAKDPQLQIFSAEIVLNVALASAPLVTFTTFHGQNPPLCSEVAGAGCQLQENGEPQGGTITWSSGGVDNIFIQGNVAPSAITGQVTQYQLNSDIPGRGSCFRTIPALPGPGWVCIWYHNHLYRALNNLLRDAYISGKTCTIDWTKTDAGGLGIIDFPECD
jgi:hypothetical protein